MYHTAKEPGMNVNRIFATPYALLLSGLLSAGSLCGCQTDIGGQTLPSAHYLRDDVQYFPAGPEFLLPNAVQAQKEYKASQQALEDDLSGR